MVKKYMAYVGSYSYRGNAKGITVYDVDVKKGTFKERCEVEVDNSSYLITSTNKKILYSIADEGIVAFKILENGDLSRINTAKINGMRGCHLCTGPNDKYIYVSGYHDGKLTVLSLNADGSVGKIVDGIYHKGLGSVVERNFRPHVSCTKPTPDGNFILAGDLGIDQVKIYRFDKEEGRLMICDSIPCDINSAPRTFKFSSDGKFLYLMYEMKNVIDVFTYNYIEGKRTPDIEKIQTIPANPKFGQKKLTAATAISFTSDEKYLFCANAGDDAVCVYKRDADTGLLSYKFFLPISGEYPKDVAIFPDDKHIASINHGSGSITFFKVDYEKNLIVMNANALKVNQPNCCVIVEV